MPIVGANNELYFATGIDNSGLMRGRQQAVGIVRGMASQISREDVFAGLAVAATLAFTKMSKEIKQFSEEYEHTMREVQTISKAVQQDFAGYNQEIIELSTKVPQSANELGKAYYQIVSAGYDGAAGLNLLKIASEGAVGGVSDVITAADGLTTVMNAWKVSAEDASLVSDVFFNTVKLGKTTFSELANNIAQAAPLAAAYGISMQEIFSATASLTKQGTTTSMAMTQIRQAMISLNEKLGEGWSETMTFQEGLVELTRRAEDAGETLRDYVGGRIEGLNAILALTGKNTKGAAEDLKSYENAIGASEEAFRTMVQDSINQSKILQNNLKAALKPLGDFLAGKSTEFAKKLNEAFESGKMEEYAKFVGITTAALVAYKLTANGAALTTNILAKATLASTAAMKGLTTAFRSNPLGVIALGVTAAVTAFKAFKRSRDQVTETGKKFNEEIGGDIFSLNSLFESLKKAKKGTDEWNTARDTINSRYGEYLDNLVDEKTNLEDIEAAQKRVTEALIANAGVKIYKGQLEAQWENYQEKFQKSLGEFTEAFSQFKGADRLPEFIMAINEGIDQAIEEGGGTIERGMLEYSQIATDIYNEFIDDISKQTGYVKWDPKAFTKGFLDIAEFKAKEADFTTYLEGMVKSFQKSIDRLMKKPEEDDSDDDGSGTGVLKILDPKALEDQIKAAENAYAQLEQLRKAGLEKESRDLYQQYLQYGETFDRWLITMKSKYKDFMEQLNLINLEISTFVIEKTGAFEDAHIDKAKLTGSFNAAAKSIIDDINKEVKAALNVEITVPPPDEEVVEKFNLLGQLFTGEQMDQIERGMNEFGYNISRLGDTIGRFDQEAGESVRLLGQLITNAGALVNFVQSGDIFSLMGGIMGMVDAIAGWANMLIDKKHQENAEKIERQAYRIELAVQNIRNGLEEQYKILNKLDGLPFLSTAEATIKKINTAIEAIIGQMQNMRFELDFPGLPEGLDVWMDTSEWDESEFKENLKKYGEMVDKETRAQLEDYLATIQEYRDKIEELKMEIKIETVGFDVSDLVQSVMDVFRDMEEGAMDFGRTFQEIMRDALMNAFEQRYVLTAMDEFYDELYKALDSPASRRDRSTAQFGNIDEDEYAYLEDLWNTITEQMGTQFEGLKGFLESVGLDLSSLEEDRNSLRGAIRRDLTEETGTLLAGRMNNIMLTQQEMAGYQLEMVGHLAAIERNTHHNRHLSEIRGDIKQIRKQLSE